MRLKVIGEVAAGRPFTTADRHRARRRASLPAALCLTAPTRSWCRNRPSATAIASRCKSASAKGRNVRTQGLDFRSGETLFGKGHRLSARDLALAAGMNHPLVPVYRRPKVALFATGDELVPPGTEPGPGQIVYSNGFALAALAREEGAEVIDLGVVGDKLDDTDRRGAARPRSAAPIFSSPPAALRSATTISCRRRFAAEGMDLSFWKIAMRPGRPLMHGRLGAMHVLGVPGNPVSSYVCAFLFLVPLIRRSAGAPISWRRPNRRCSAATCRRTTSAPITCARRSSNGPAAPVATPFPAQDSSMMAPLAKADCLVIREPYAPAAKAGSPCSIVKFER